MRSDVRADERVRVQEIEDAHLRRSAFIRRPQAFAAALPFFSFPEVLRERVVLARRFTRRVPLARLVALEERRFARRPRLRPPRLLSCTLVACDTSPMFGTTPGFAIFSAHV